MALKDTVKFIADCKRKKQELANILQRYPSMEELAEACDLEVDKVLDILKRDKKCVFYLFCDVLRLQKCVFCARTGVFHAQFTHTKIWESFRKRISSGRLLFAHYQPVFIHEIMY